jgi:hypothetical protein
LWPEATRRRELHGGENAEPELAAAAKAADSMQAD